MKMTLQEFRFSLDLTQRQFAEKIGYSREAIARCERMNSITPKMLFRIKRVYPDFLENVEVGQEKSKNEK